MAGSDPSGGAGIQADLKTFSALGVYGTAVLTALTAQNTRGVTGVHVPPARFVWEQLDTLVADLTLDAVKIGMLADASVVTAVADWLDVWRGSAPGVPVVLDPVMVSTSGHTLLADEAIATLLGLIPEVDLITPNLHEAALVLGRAVATSVDKMFVQADALVRAGARAVLLKGGHLRGTSEATDVLVDADGPRLVTRPFVDTVNTHGTGCTLSSAIAATAALQVHAGPGSEPPSVLDGHWAGVVDEARDYLTSALRGGASWRLGAGAGPVDHGAGRVGQPTHR